MTIAKRLKQGIPFVILFLLLSMLWHELYSAGANKHNASIIGDPLPNFSLPVLGSPNKTFSPANLKGKVTLINVFASWCSACNAEHDMMMKIRSEYGIPIYGILYRDRANDAIQWLARKGNPYVMVGNDSRGVTGVDFGIYGTPETFLVSPQGRIIYRHPGVIDQSTWDNDIYPLIKQYRE